MEVLTTRIYETLTSSINGLHTRNEDVHNRTNEREYAFDPCFTNCREAYQNFKDDEKPIEHLKTIGPSLDRIISQIQNYDGSL
jgi:hypothetical protein